MKYIIKIPILLSVLVITGCFTILTHPEVEVVYQHQNEKNNYSEDYDVYVDEDCNACHTDFRVIKHFNPLLSAHNNAWNATPWWFDDKYMVIFDRETGKEEQVYQPVPTETSSSTNTAVPHIVPQYGSSSAGSSPPASTSSTKKETETKNIVKPENKESSKIIKSSKRKLKKRN